MRYQIEKHTCSSHVIINIQLHSAGKFTPDSVLMLTIFILDTDISMLYAPTISIVQITNHAELG